LTTTMERARSAWSQPDSPRKPDDKAEPIEALADRLCTRAYLSATPPELR
jgi:hypothetical protein